MTQPGANPVYEYTVTYRREDGSIGSITLDGVDDDHAKEEASYEIGEPYVEILAARRGPYLYENEL